MWWILLVIGGLIGFVLMMLSKDIMGLIFPVICTLGIIVMLWVIRYWYSESNGSL